MARFDVYPHPEGNGWLLDIQNDLLSGFKTRVVVPLLPPSKAPQPAERLNPTFLIGTSEAVMLTQFMAAVPIAILKDPIANLSNERVSVIAALDMVFQGF